MFLFSAKNSASDSAEKLKAWLMNIQTKTCVQKTKAEREERKKLCSRTLSLGFLGVFDWRFLGSVWLLLLPRASISNSQSNLRPQKNCRSSSNRSIDSRNREMSSKTTEAREGRRRREEDRMEARPSFSFSRGLRDRRGKEGLRNPWKSTYP